MDEELRELERCWQSSGSDADELRLLRARLRLGLVDESSLAVAGRLFGHFNAAQLLSEPVGKPPRAFARWLELLLRADDPAWRDLDPKAPPWRWQLAVRAALAAAFEVLDWARKYPDELPRWMRSEAAMRLPHAALSGARRWALDPSVAARAVADAALELDTLWWGNVQVRGVKVAIHAARAAVGSRSGTVPPSAEFVLDEVREAVQVAVREKKIKRVRAALERDLVPWLLGHGDPLRS